MGGLIRRPVLRIHYGSDALDQLGPELERLAVHRPLVLHGRSLDQNASLQSRLSMALKGTHGVDSIGRHRAVERNSPAAAVESAARAAERHRADCLVALGGGSAAVTARAAAIFIAEGKDLSAISTSRGPDGVLRSPKLLRPKLPIVVLGTTPSTAFGKAGAAVTRDGHRHAMFDPKTRATAIILDPALLASAPGGLVQGAALNAFSMAVEGLMSKGSNVFADAELSHGLHLLQTLLPEAAEADAPDKRVTLGLAALLIGSGTDTAGGGAAAALSHVIGHQYKGLHNGYVDAVLLPHVLDVAVREVPERAGRVAEAMSILLEDLPSRTSELLACCAPASRLRDLGLTRSSLPEIVADALDDFAQGGAPFHVTDKLLQEILLAAW